MEIRSVVYSNHKILKYENMGGRIWIYKEGEEEVYEYKTKVNGEGLR